MLGCYAHGLFESPVVMRTMFGLQVPSLDTVFDTLADRAEEHFVPGVLDRLFGA